MPPPPPPPLTTATERAVAATAVGQDADALPPPFTVVRTGEGDAPSSFTFDFPPATGKGRTAGASVSLRAVVTRYLSAPQLRSFAPEQLLLILGRLRCLHYTLLRYNEGLRAPSPAFERYWRPRALEQLSGFGFQVAHATQPIVIEGLGELVARVEDVFAAEMVAARETIACGMITFDALGELYRPDVPVKGMTALGASPGVFLVCEYFYEERRALLGMERSFHCTLDFVATMGEHFSIVRFAEVLSGWTGVRARPLSELTYVPLIVPDERAALDARGRKYVDIARGAPRFLAYAPQSFFLHATAVGGGGGGNAGRSALANASGSLLLKGGRVMIDPARGALLGHHASQGGDEPTHALITLAGRYRRWLNTQAGGASGSSGSGSVSGQDGLMLWDDVPGELAIYCWPAIVGFSFTAKVWGHVLVTGLEPIQFNDRAFDQLVLAEERKQLIRALVRFGSEGDTDDIIGGKRGGSVFLLHGPPGVGKTLTAEAIAEVLHRPLYYVTMGELGLTPDEMERRLSDVLDLCAGWNALTLLDEADVFLETRSTADIVRNAMVCVMLRLLEYHPGILFLTTNRVRSFDPAFESRVTVALRYDHLTPGAREQIWRNLLQRVAVTVTADVDYAALGAHVLNGRQIKNAVRLAVALTRERGGASVTQAVLDATLAITNIGRDEIRADDSWRAE